MPLTSLSCQMLITQIVLIQVQLCDVTPSSVLKIQIQTTVIINKYPS